MDVDAGSTGTRDRVLSQLVDGGFPIDAKPYCVLGDRTGVLEGDVLEVVTGLRMDGTISRVGASFSGDGCALLADDEMVLADLVSGDLPMSEDPYAELGAELVRRGVEADESWVLGRLASWSAQGVISSFGVTLGGSA